MQFHPTALRLEGPRDGFLVTEAVRGEGARLYDSEGERFVDELAPRDEVALAIQTELRPDGRAGRLARHAARGGGALPEHRRGARGRGPRPGA